jgi:apolipoprotein N-acyltransferase
MIQTFLDKNHGTKTTASMLVVAATLYTVSLMYISQSLAVLGYFIFAYCLFKTTTAKQAFYTGGLFGFANSLTLHLWMFPVINNYAKGNVFLALLCYLINAFVLALFSAVPASLFHYSRLPAFKKLALFYNALLLACLWLLFEALRSEAFSAMPWLSYTTGITAAKNIYLIQPAACGGVLIISFIIFLLATTTAAAVLQKKPMSFLLPLCLFVLQLAGGYFMFGNIQKKLSPQDKSISVALILPALSPETVWNDQSANGLVTQLLTLNKQAAARKTDLIVWTETVVPWTFAADDDFVKEITTGSKTHHLIGMNSANASSSDILCNSVYLLDAQGKAEGRYDKQDLLTLVEKPLFDESGSVILPFLSSNGVAMRSGGHSLPVETPWGKAGIMLCNESTSASLANKLTHNGASFLVNIGNDNWFEGNYITGQHFYNDRLRAVENRKDILVNNNKGYSGVIKASGEIALQVEGKQSSVQVAEVQPNNLPAPSPFTFIVVIACLAGVLITLVFIQKFI